MTRTRPVRTAYVVLTHRDWPQVHRLAQAILRSSPGAGIVLAHDARHDAFPVDAGDARIDVFAHGRDADWGSWDLVEATLDAFARARELFDPDLVCLISGSDYPVQDLAAWEKSAVEAGGWIGAAEPLTYVPHWGRRRGEGDDRWTRYAYRWFRAPFGRRASPFIVRVRTALALRLEPIFGIRIVTRGRGLHYGVRRLPIPFTPERPVYFGSQWLAVRRSELDRLLDVDFRAGAPLRRLYRRSIIPDESAFVTALSRSGPRGELPPVSYVRWDAARDEPVIWTVDDLDEIRASGSPFCRKVDPVLSSELLDALDAG